jgi:hypothetical protein
MNVLAGVSVIAYIRPFVFMKRIEEFASDISDAPPAVHFGPDLDPLASGTIGSF